MPYGTVNLLHGVNPGETPVTCTAGIGTFIVEFATLSHLTGDPVFEDVARKALKALWKNRSDIGLVSEEWPGNLLPCFRCSFLDAVLRVEEPEPGGDRTRQITSALITGCGTGLPIGALLQWGEPSVTPLFCSVSGGWGQTPSADCCRFCRAAVTG